MNDPQRILIIGGGIIGCSIAWELAKAGRSVTLVDKGRLGEEATSAAAGMLGAHVELHHPGPFFELCKISRELYRGWTEELKEESGISAQYIGEGIVRIARDDEDERELRSRLVWMDGAVWCGPDEMRRLEPALAPEVRGGLYLPDDHQIHPVALARALRAALFARGCAVREGVPALSLIREGDRVTGVRTAEGDLFADAVILAAGAWSAALVQPLGVELPVFPVKGQCLSLRPDKPVNVKTVFTRGCYIVPRLDGTVTIGATQEEAGFDKTATVPAIAALHETAAALLPGLADAAFVSTWTGLRPGSPEAVPYLGPLDEVPGLVFAAGHYRNGILLAPVTARLIRQLLLGETPIVPPEPFLPQRRLRLMRAQ
jgi:glycine oxidase